MKFRTIRYHITQAAESLFHNRLMTLAAMATVAACCFILILTMGLILNIDYMLSQIEQTVGISVYLGDEVTDDEAKALRSEVESIPHVKTVEYISKEDAFEKFRDDLGTDGSQLDSLKEDNPLPRSFEITVDGLKNQDSVITSIEELQISFEKRMTAARGSEDITDDTIEQINRDIKNEAENAAAELYGEYMTVINADDASAFSDNAEENAEAADDASADAVSEETTAYIPDDGIGGSDYQYRGIEKIRHARDVSNILMAVSANVHVVAIILLIVMMVISVAIIMNTIKLTVFIRRNEINIMKYIGATDSFIRWPFILEGVIIGFVGALLPTFICMLAYGKLYDNYMNYFDMLRKIVEMKPTDDIFSLITPVTLIFGSVLGVIGSITSIRKHLNV